MCRPDKGAGWEVTRDGSELNPRVVKQGVTTPEYLVEIVQPCALQPPKTNLIAPGS